jgi:hypothetical protein
MTIEQRISAKQQQREALISEHKEHAARYQAEANAMNDITKKLLAVEGALLELNDLAKEQA